MKFRLDRNAMAAAAMLALALVNTLPAANAADTRAVTASQDSLQSQLDALAQQALPGTLGISVLDLQSGKTWRVNADQAYPMMSVFKPAVAATVLDRVDHGLDHLGETLTITRKDLENGAIRDQFHGEQMSFTLERMLHYMVSESDNTAVDALIRHIGGPAVVESYLHAHGVDGMRVDRGEDGNARLFEALQPGETAPANETDVQQDQRYLRGYHLFIADPGNRSTPDAAVLFLRKLWQHELLPAASTQRLLDLMYAQTTPNRLRAGLPANVKFADKCGTSVTVDGLTAAYNDFGIMTWPDGHTVIVAAFLTASNAPVDQRQGMFEKLAGTIAAALHP
jgi:beta-lactamase class A